MSWETIKLADVCDLQNGFAFKSNDYVENSSTCNIRMSNIRQGGIFDEYHNEKYLPDEFATKYKDYLLKDGDLIIAMTDLANETKILGLPTLVENTSGRNFLLNQRVGKLCKFSNKIYVPYLRYFLSSPNVIEYYKSKGAGGLQINISKKDILSVQIKLPPLPIQQKIVEKLDAIFTEIDKALLATEANVKNAEALFQSYLTEVFEKLISKNKSTPLKNVCEFENGDRGKNYPSKQHQVESGIPFINAGDLKDDWRISRNGMAFITEERFNLLGAGKVKLGDLLFCLRGSLGKCGIVEDIEIGAIASSLVIIRPMLNVSVSKYLYWFLSSSICARYINETSGGAAQPNLSAKTVMNYLIPMITYEKQLEVAKQIDDFYLNTSQIKKSYLDKLIGLNHLKQSVLQQAFNGKLIKE